MTTATLNPPPSPSSQSPHTLTFGGVLRSEWIKLRSTRSTNWSYLITALGIWGIALLGALVIANYSDVANLAELKTKNLDNKIFNDYFVSIITGSVSLTGLVVAILGVLVISGEYSTGMIRSTLTAVPTRTPVLVGKAIILFLTTYAITFIAQLLSFPIVAIILTRINVTANLFDSNIFLPLLGCSLFLSLTALLSLTVGTMVRSSAGGIGIMMTLLLVVPGLLFALLPMDWRPNITPFLFTSAGTEIYTRMDQPTLSLPQAILVTLIWNAVTFIGAMILLKRRDA
ncbi:MAG: hypothetical protein B5766_07550 [Candidatus Lumbricidophila eiseniae]|uniref:ABC transporter permease n=1 Tax=Candidatus Lumbricidiphila eiseniae TaxID=1969409 RepID=A0A2A6FQK7_9MICO|nr:MAG: hypothetical protein B5766_07550 [Candidatus Lumbricidophila eiseniae]